MVYLHITFQIRSKYGRPINNFFLQILSIFTQQFNIICQIEIPFCYPLEQQMVIFSRITTARVLCSEAIIRSNTWLLSEGKRLAAVLRRSNQRLSQRKKSPYRFQLTILGCYLHETGTFGTVSAFGGCCWAPPPQQWVHIPANGRGVSPTPPTTFLINPKQLRHHRGLPAATKSIYQRASKLVGDN